MEKTYTLTFPGVNDGEPVEHDIEFQILADISYTPGNYSGPPERCYPDESECVINEVKPLTTLDGMTDQDLIDALYKQVGEDKLTDDLWEDWQADRDDAAQQYADWKNDEEMIRKLEESGESIF